MHQNPSFVSITLVQSAVPYTTIAENLAYLEEFIAENINTSSSQIDLLIFPEMFAQPFGIHPSQGAEHVNGMQTKWLAMIANRYQCYVVGGVIIKQEQKFFNRALIISPQGKIVAYDKQALFPNTPEKTEITRGSTDPILPIKDFKIKFRICYDLRFPLLHTNQFNGENKNTSEYDILIFLAQWPAKRINHWDTLLKARAIENRCYTIGVNRCDTYQNADYIGHSNIYKPNGTALTEPIENPFIQNFQISLKDLQTYRLEHPYHF